MFFSATLNNYGGLHGTKENKGKKSRLVKGIASDQ
jgi:hypothetical protein